MPNLIRRTVAGEATLSKQRAPYFTYDMIPARTCFWTSDMLYLCRHITQWYRGRRTADLMSHVLTLAVCVPYSTDLARRGKINPSYVRSTYYVIAEWLPLSSGCLLGCAHRRFPVALLFACCMGSLLGTIRWQACSMPWLSSDASTTTPCGRTCRCPTDSSFNISQ